MHIPKAAGTSFRQVLEREYRNKLVSVYDPLEVENGPQIKDAQAYVGHFRFGFHEKCGINSGFKYCGFIREPVSHAWSHFHYLKSLNRLPIEIQGWEQFLQHKWGYNLQLRFLVGHDNLGDRAFEMLEQAKANIDKYFLLLAPVEEFELGLLSFSAALNWKRWPVYHPANFQSTKPIIGPEEKALAQEVLAPEIGLYSWTLNHHFKEKIKHLKPKPSPAAFRVLNLMYKHLDPLYILLKKLK